MNTGAMRVKALGFLFGLVVSGAGFTQDWGNETFEPTGTQPSRAITDPDVAVAFDEAEFSSGPAADGFSTSTIGGVPIPAPLSFSDDSGSASLGVGGPGAQTFVDPPGFEGSTAATVGISYGAPAEAASFGFALLCMGSTASPGVTVDLLNSSGAVVDTVVVDGLDTGGFPENEFETNTPHSALRLTFNTADCSNFFVDNLAYRYGGESVAVPAIGLRGLGVMALLLAVIGFLSIRMVRS